MMNTGKLAGRTLFITGASRGIGKAIALKAARDGANIVIAAKTAEPHPKLPGTIFTAAQEVEAVGGKALPCVVDVRDEAQVQKAVQQAVEKFGGIDILVNNASAISLTGTAETEMKKYDLMQNINTRGTYLVSKTCLPHLKASSHAHILNLSPPLNMKPHWFANHVAYTIAKYGMSMCALGMAEEFKPYNISVNALWPRTAILTAAIEMLSGPESNRHSRKPEIMADAAYHILSSTPPSITGQFLIDDEVLARAGITDLDQYRADPSSTDPLMQDFFLDEVQTPSASKQSDDKPDNKVAELFLKIDTTLSSELADKTQALYEFVVTGNDAGKWYIDLRPGNTATGKGEPPSKPDATLTMDSKHFFEMFGGKLKPATAYMTGKLKIAGNLQKALKLEKLMKGLKSKL